MTKLLTNYLGFFLVLISVLSLVNIIYCYYFNIFLNIDTYIYTLLTSLSLGFVLLFIAVAIIAPIGEELLFRGFFQQVLEKHWKDVTRAILMTALIFSMIHMNPYWFAQIYILGIILGFIAWKTKSVLPALILHGMNNAMAMLFAFVDLEKNNLYIWNGHVAPWIILFAIYTSYYGFSGINRMNTKS